VSPGDISATDADPAAELLGLLSAEFAEGGIDSSVVESDEDVPAQLVVDLPDGSVIVCFVPELENPPVLQYIVALDVDVVAGAETALARFVAIVNSSLPLTGFEFSEAAASVVFRHIQAVSVHPLDPAVVAWPLSMIHYAVTRYGPLVAAVAGGQDLATAVAEFTTAERELLGES
jgi:hypothetical protein